MSVAHLDLSIPLQRAAQAEHERVGVAVARIDERLQVLDAERETLRAEKARLRQRQQLLEQIMDPTLDGEIDESPGVVLRGARLRIEATRLLMRHVGPGRPTHYREWYDLFLQGGFILLGKRPEAAFLTAVGRSPIVRRGEEPGTFFIDLALAGELATDLAEVQAELADLESVLARDPNPASHLRQYRVKLLARRRQLDSRVSEAEAALVAQSPLDDKAQGMAS